MTDSLEMLYSEAHKTISDAKDRAREVLDRTETVADEIRKDLAERGIESRGLKILWQNRWGSINFYLEGVLEIPEDMTNPKALEILNDLFTTVKKPKDAPDFDFQKRDWKYDGFDKDNHIKVAVFYELW